MIILIILVLLLGISILIGSVLTHAEGGYEELEEMKNKAKNAHD